MASLSAKVAKHATLTGTTVDTVTLTTPGRRVEILNRSATEILSVTIDGSTPTALGDETYVVPASQVLTLPVPLSGCVVKIIGNGNPYSVMAVLDEIR